MKRLLIVLGVVLAVPAAALGHGFRDEEAMNELLVSSGADHVHATPGSGCMTHKQPDGTGVGLCEDKTGDLPVTGRLDLVTGQPIRFYLDHPIVDLHAAVHATDGRGPGKRLLKLEPRPVQGETPGTLWEADFDGGLPATDLRLVAQARYDPNANPTGDRSFQAAATAPGRRPAPRAAIAAARRRAQARLGESAKVTFSLRSQRRPRWALVDGRRGRKLWAAWVRRRDSGRWRVERFRTSRFDPAGVPCDIRPAFSEPSC